MHRIDADGHVGNLFDDGDPAIPQVATQVDAAWLNAVQEEVCNAIEGAGVTLVKGTNTQLRDAIQTPHASQGVDPGGRLSLVNGVSVSGADISAAGTVYYTPHVHNRIRLYNGSRWVWYEFTTLSQATTDNTKSPAACANNSSYDVFVWNDSGTLRATRGPAWTSDTARGAGAGTTEIEFFEGRYVNKVAITNGPAARRGVYAGSIRTDGSAVVNDTLAKRHVWNMYHRVRQPMRVNEATASWNYTSATFQQANNSAANQLDFLLGLQFEHVEAQVWVVASNTDNGVNLQVAIGLDGVSIPSSGVDASPTTVAGQVIPVGASYKGYPQLGRHYLAWIERSAAVGTTTWYGTGTFTLSGIEGSIFA